MLNRMCIPLFSALLAVAFASTPSQAKAQPVAQVLDIVVGSVDFQQGQLVALAEVTLDVAGDTVTQDVEIPLSLGATSDPNNVCDILNLSVGPLDLDLLGLVVELDDCEGGPVTVDILALGGEGLLGDLLCGIAGLLDGGVPLGDILGLLEPEELDAVTGAIRDVLNAVFDQFLTGASVAGTNAVSAQQNGGSGGGNRCDILTLEIPGGLSLEVLGLLVDTSGICLDVYAQRGSGNLLGNLLCAVTNLLDSNASPNAIDNLLNSVGRLLGRLGLI